LVILRLLKYSGMPQAEATPLPQAWCNIFMIHTPFFCL
jgi:hypothetical protein